jgi:hypothetical protein
VAIRIEEEGQRLSMKLDRQKEDDKVIFHNEEPLVLLDPHTSEIVAPHTLDVEENRLVLK